jgi:hypothetical protein
VPLVTTCTEESPSRDEIYSAAMVTEPTAKEAQVFREESHPLIRSRVVASHIILTGSIAKFPKNGVSINLLPPDPHRLGKLPETRLFRPVGALIIPGSCSAEHCPLLLSDGTTLNPYRVGQFHFGLLKSVAPPRIVSPNSFSSCRREQGGATVNSSMST